MKTSSILSALKPVVEAFEKLKISYYIGGSVASSAYGLARTTLDVDLVSDIKLQHVPPLTEKLESAYYVDSGMMISAIREQSSFNLIHLETMIKIDVFILKDRPYDRGAFQRKRKDTLEEEQKSADYYLASPEDVIISKMEWFCRGGKISERQWNDVLGILKIQGNNLDVKYLKHWSAELGLIDLLIKAFDEAGLKTDS